MSESHDDGGDNGAAIWVTYALVALVIGLPIACFVGTRRERRRRNAPARPAGPDPVTTVATIAAGWGMTVALPVSCLLAGPVAKLIISLS
jgi:hypothetical protein